MRLRRLLSAFLICEACKLSSIAKSSMNSENATPNQPDGSPNTASEIQSAEPITPPETTRATNQELQEVRTELTGYERSTLKLTWIIVGVNLLTCFFVGLQWREMKSGSADTHDLAIAAKAQAGKMSDVSTAADKIREAANNMVIQDQRIADNAGNSLDASNKQGSRVLKANIAAAHLDQRAWIFIPSCALDNEIGVSTAAVVTCTVINSGKTPAVSAVNQNAFGLSSLSKIPEPNWTKIKPGPKVIIPPSGPDQNGFTFHVSFGPVSKDFANSYNNKIHTFYLMTLVSYYDVFGQAHWTKICFTHTADTGLEAFRFCDQDNETDTHY